MAETPVAIKLGGQTFIKTSDMKVVSLTKPTYNATTETLHDTATTDYQVPTGKVFKALEIYHVQSVFTTGDSLVLYISDTADTADGTVAGIFSSPIEAAAKANIDIDFAADKFTTIVSNSGPLIWVLLIGIEMDA